MCISIQIALWYAYGFSRRWLNKKAIVSFWNVMFRRRAHSKSLQIKSYFAVVYRPDTMLWLWLFGLAHAHQLTFSTLTFISTWKRNSWTIHVISCVAVLYAVLGQWDKSSFSTMCTDIFWILSKTYTHTNIQYSSHAYYPSLACEHWLKIMSFQYEDISICSSFSCELCVVLRCDYLHSYLNFRLNSLHMKMTVFYWLCDGVVCSAVHC